MKKLLIALSVLFIMSGCDNNNNTKNLSCTSTITASNGVTTKTNYNIDYMDDKVKHVTITYAYSQGNNTNDVDGVNSDTDGLEEDNNNNNTVDSDEVVDGIVGDVIDETLEGVSETILDIAGIKNRYENQLSTYDDIEGLTYDVEVDNNTEYTITYKIDMDKISDDNLSRFNVPRTVTDMRTNYENSGFTCK